MEKWLIKFLQEKENQEYINSGNWEELYNNLSFLMNTVEIEPEDAWQLTSALHDSGINILYDQNLKGIPNHMFYGCKDNKFRVIEIPDPITSIGTEAFSMSESIRKIILPKNLEGILPYAFAYSDIEEVHYPGTEKEFYENVILGDEVFEDANKLKMYFDAENKVKIM